MKPFYHRIIILFVVYCCSTLNSSYAQMIDAASYLTQRIAIIKEAPDKRAFLLRFIKDMQIQIQLFTKSEQERKMILQRLQLDHQALLLSVFNIGEPLANSSVQKNTSKAYGVSIQTLHGGEFPQRHQKKFKRYTAAVINGLDLRICWCNDNSYQRIVLHTG